MNRTTMNLLLKVSRSSGKCMYVYVYVYAYVSIYIIYVDICICIYNIYIYQIINDCSSLTLLNI